MVCIHAYASVQVIPTTANIASERTYVRLLNTYRQRNYGDDGLFLEFFNVHAQRKLIQALFYYSL
jgi:hypothetical protein